MFYQTYKVVQVVNLNLLEEAVRDINELHKNFSDAFYNNFYSSEFNLKNVTISNVLFEQRFNPFFLEYLEIYHRELNNYIWTESDFSEKFLFWDARIRVKQKDSIYNKLIFYGEKAEKGKIPIQKCLNDLLGFRLIMEDFDFLDKGYKDLLLSLKADLNLMKCYDRDVDGYKGSHIYFKNKNNFYYPWELQLWNSSDAELNEKSHKEHKSKRDYLNWPKKYKEGRIQKG